MVIEPLPAGGVNSRVRFFFRLALNGMDVPIEGWPALASWEVPKTATASVEPGRRSVMRSGMRPGRPAREHPGRMHRLRTPCAEVPSTEGNLARGIALSGHIDLRRKEPTLLGHPLSPALWRRNRESQSGPCLVHGRA